MDSESQQMHRMTNGIFSKGEREFFRGEKEVENPDAYRNNARYRARKRMEQIEDDLELARESGQGDLVDDFYQKFGRVERLEKEIERLRSELDEEREDD